MTKTPLRGLLLFALVCSSLTAQAYDLDTHFYGTYSMARFAGIRHEVATKIATGVQWMDESYISDPLSMIILPDVGVKKRRLLHFPGSRLASKMTVSTLPSFLDPSSGVKLKSFTETEADHEFATEMFTEGLMQGDLMKASAGLHTLEDSFAHAGTIAELGHAHFWHHPDRPYVDDQSIAKYFKMCRSVLRAMVAIRSLLPMSAVDTELQFGPIPNYKLNGDLLADIYVEMPQVKAAISRKILNEPSFVRFALDFVFDRAQKVNYIKPGYQKYLGNFAPGQDAYDAASSIAKTLPPEMINIEAIMKDSGRPNLSAEYIISMGGMSEFAMRVIRDLLSGIVPRPMDAYHRFEKEEDGSVWIKELDLRVANMRSLIFELYGKDIFFVKNNTGNEKGYLKEMLRQPEANTVLPASNGKTEYVTYTLNEKVRFNHMIFTFLFPKLAFYLKNDIEGVNDLIIQAQKELSEDQSYMDKLGGITSFLGSAIKLKMGGVSFIESIKIAREDIGSGRLIPNEFNKFYVVPTLLRRQIDRGVFKPLLTNQQVDQYITGMITEDVTKDIDHLINLQLVEELK
ncbi:hypothetical protein K2P97_12535 [bacterium]|nr:hypothetical protein [bacterium]